jgi:hypothetical protein
LATLTYIDSCVLLYAAQGTAILAERALRFLFDPEREYATSDYVRLELVPHARYHKRQAEVEFYETFFQSAIKHIPTSKTIHPKAPLNSDRGERAHVRDDQFR